jgi:hypothetical protein
MYSVVLCNPFCLVERGGEKEGGGYEGGLHGLISYMDIQSKCRHLKNLPVNGLCSRSLSV